MTTRLQADPGLRAHAGAAWAAFAFVIAGAASIVVSRFGDGISGAWLANVCAFALLARRARPAGPVDYLALFAASLAVNAAFRSDPAMALLLSFVNVGQIALALFLVRQGAGALPLRAPGARDFVLVLLLGGGASTAIVALAFMPAAYLVGGWPPLWAGWTLVSANALGFAMLLPPLLFVSRRELARLAQPGPALRLVATCLACAGIGCLSLSWGQFPFALAMLPLLVVALRAPVLDLAIACSFTGAALVVGGMMGLVPGLGQGIDAFRNGFQMAAAIAVATPFIVGLFVHQIVDDRRLIDDAETRWNFAMASAGQGVWDVDMRKGGISYSATWASMLGYEQQELDGDPDHWLTMVHPDDREAVEAADRAHMEGRTPHFEAEFRMRHKQGHWIWILDRGKVIERDSNGDTVRAIGSLTDITARKEAEQRLAVSAALLAAEKERLRVTLQSIGDAVICTNAAGTVTFMNPVAENLTGVSGADAIGNPLDEVYRAQDEETGEGLGVMSRMSGGQRRSDQNSRAVLVRRDGTRCSIRQVVSPIVNGSDAFEGAVIVFQDFTDARTLQRQLAYAATHDALTGLANRSSFIRAMEELVAETRAGGAEHQFMFLDLDRFKQVNDTGGHAAGDALLKQVAVAIRDALGPDDIVARLGGDEFAVVMKARSIAQAETAAAAVLAAVRMLDFAWNGQSHEIGASIGLAPIRADSGEADEIIARADAACYAAKNAGRGCAFVALGGPDEAASATLSMRLAATGS